MHASIQYSFQLLQYFFQYLKIAFQNTRCVVSLYTITFCFCFHLIVSWQHSLFVCVTEFSFLGLKIGRSRQIVRVSERNGQQVSWKCGYDRRERSKWVCESGCVTMRCDAHRGMLGSCGLVNWVRRIQQTMWLSENTVRIRLVALRFSNMRNRTGERFQMSDVQCNICEDVRSDSGSLVWW